MVASLEAARQASCEGQHQRAVDLCAAVLRQWPGEPRAFAFLALALWRASAFERAVDALQQALQHYPAQEELSLALLDAWLAVGQDSHPLPVQRDVHVDADTLRGALVQFGVAPGPTRPEPGTPSFH